MPTSRLSMKFAIFQSIKEFRLHIIGTSVSAIICITFTECTRFLMDDVSTLRMLLFLTTFLCSYFFPTICVGIYIHKSFTKDKNKLKTILASYFSILLSFSFLYYSMSALGDYVDAHSNYSYYERQRKYLEGKQIEVVLPRVKSDRAFRGINSKFWSGVEDRALPYFISRESDYPAFYLAENTLIRRDRVIRFNGNNRVKIFLDCLHFSTATMTTLGFGDIVPNKWYTKLAADIQVITGVILLVVALGLFFGENSNVYRKRREKGIKKIKNCTPEKTNRE